MTDLLVTATASRVGKFVRLQVWAGDLGNDTGMVQSAYLTAEAALALSKRLAEIASQLPREASAADLGIAA